MKKGNLAFAMAMVFLGLAFVSIILPVFFKECLTEEITALCVIAFCFFGSAFGFSVGISVIKTDEEVKEETREFLAKNSHYDDD